MSTIPTSADQSLDRLVQAVHGLDSATLDQFATLVLSVRARRNQISLPGAEANLLAKVNRPLPENTERRFAELVEKRDEETITEDELCELRGLTDVVEAFDADRVENLIKLAQLRGVTLNDLMTELEAELDV